MPSRWLKPTERISGDYSTITFAISDSDGSIANTLLSGRAALFGKEVEVQRWVEKPALVQCSRCHILGHIKTSRACPLDKDSVRCYICEGSHQTEAHDQNCHWNHAVAGICDCKHFKCINCHKTGHNSRDPWCPARDLFCPRTNHRQRKSKNKGKKREWYLEEGPNTALPNRLEEDLMDEYEDLYALVPTPRNPINRQLRTAQHHRGIDKICNRLDEPMSQLLKEDNGTGTNNFRSDYDPELYPDTLNLNEPMKTSSPPLRASDYSPSCPQGGVINSNLA